MRAVLALALAAMPCLFAAPARAMTVDEIVARNIQAHGGIDRMHAIQSMRMTSKARFGDGDFTVEMDFVALMLYSAMAGATRAVLEAGASAKMVVRLREELLVLCQGYAAKSLRSN